MDIIIQCSVCDSELTFTEGLTRIGKYTTLTLFPDPCPECIANAIADTEANFESE